LDEHKPHFVAQLEFVLVKCGYCRTTGNKKIVLSINYRQIVLLNMFTLNISNNYGTCIYI